MKLQHQYDRFNFICNILMLIICCIKWSQNPSLSCFGKFQPYSTNNIILEKQTNTVKPVLTGHSKGRPKIVFKTDYHSMQVKNIAFIKLPFVSNIFILSNFAWPLKTGFTVVSINIILGKVSKSSQEERYTCILTKFSSSGDSVPPAATAMITKS